MSSVNRKIFYGIDPGSSSGAWGAVDDTGAFVGCGDLPVRDGRILALELRDILIAPEHIAVEEVGVRPGQGISSSGKFMRAAGAIEAVAALTGAQVRLVRPQVWKAYHGLLKTEKQDSLRMARLIWPDAPLKLAKHHGRADALLMALWGLCN
jgi:Holliday junction resolvasome RuvABC endonuclease subunit